jgi:hypothetical protein
MNEPNPFPTRARILSRIFPARPCRIFSQTILKHVGLAMEMYVPMPGIGQLVDERGQFASPNLEKRLRSQATGFVGFVERLRGRKLRA